MLWVADPLHVDSGKYGITTKRTRVSIADLYMVASIVGVFVSPVELLQVFVRHHCLCFISPIYLTSADCEECKLIIMSNIYIVTCI